MNTKISRVIWFRDGKVACDGPESFFSLEEDREKFYTQFFINGRDEKLMKSPTFPNFFFFS